MERSGSDEPVEIPGDVVIKKTDENALGIGSYGAVYRATIGNLPCAAKILHPTLFHAADPGTDRIRNLFERECRVLRRIRHPHVIQYIKSFQDIDTRLPVLLMELMDESLTHYLEGLAGPVAHHVKLNIAHDIALALEFLHGIGILHRDLSSNNVLLIAGKRAKVTDFGMAKVWDSGSSQMTPATSIPGTVAYMPPESFKSGSVYTEKLDIFSLGVIYIQILTRTFPTPTDRVRQVLNDERYPSGIEVIIPERERRAAEIELITPDDPLLHIALDCISDKSFMRPYAGEICSRLETLKSTSWSDYVTRQERLEREGIRGGGGGEEGEEVRENGIDTRRMREMEEELEDTQSRLTSSLTRARELEIELEEKEKDLQEMKSKLLDLNRQHEETVRSLKDRVSEMHMNNMLLQREGSYEETAQEMTEKDRKIKDLEKELESRDEDLRKRDMLSLPLVPRTFSDSDVSSLRSPPSLLPPSEMRWKSHGTARRIEGNSCATHGSSIYFTDGAVVVVFNSNTTDWTTLPPCPTHSFSIAVVKGHPTAVGGFSKTEGTSSSLLSLFGDGYHRFWKNIYPAMKHARTSPSTVTTGNHLVVAGGRGSEEAGRSVEYFDSSTKTWSLVASLPFSFCGASAALCNDRLYLGGGKKDGKNHSSSDVLYCYLSELLTSTSQSNHQSHKKLRPFRKRSTHKVWHSVTELPCLQSTLVTCQGTLFAVGGLDRSQKIPVASVHYYSSSSNNWTQISQMTTPRSHCFAVGFRSNQVMVLGGLIEPYTTTDTIETATLD